MEELLAHPAVQAGVAPFIAGLIVTVALCRLRLGGLAIVAAFFTAAYLAAGITFTPLTATRKVFLAALIAPIAGMVFDYATRRARAAIAVLAIVAAVVVLWAFWPLLAQKQTGEAWRLGMGMAVAVAFMVAFAQLTLASDGIRAGAAALGLGLGVGIASIFAASATYGTYGIALAAGAGAFLLLQMVTGRKSTAGATLTFPATLISGLLAAGAVMLAKLPLQSMLVLSLVPVAARLPVPARSPVWLQAVLLSCYALAVAALACALAWQTP